VPLTGALDPLLVFQVLATLEEAMELRAIVTDLQGVVVAEVAVVVVAVPARQIEVVAEVGRTTVIMAEALVAQVSLSLNISFNRRIVWHTLQN